MKATNSRTQKQIKQQHWISEEILPFIEKRIQESSNATEKQEHICFNTQIKEI